MIKEIEHGQLSIDDLAKKYSFSDRTIQTRIKELGFKWLAREGVYDFIGNDESVFERNIDDVFTNRTASKRASNNKSEIESNSTTTTKNASREIASTLQDDSNNKADTSQKVSTSKENVKKTSTNDSQKTVFGASGGTIDKIDRLLAGKKTKKAYRGFYFDSDVLAVIDNVNSGIKSELINECLRKVFKEKGLI